MCRKRDLILSFFFLSLLLGCAGEEERTESVPLPREPLRSASEDKNKLFREAVNLLYKADGIYSYALTISELKEKGQLLREAARKYEQVLTNLAEVRRHVKEESDGRRIDTLMQAAMLGEQNACDSMPVLSK
jgi:FtsZ-binding cell division protein ZapB